MNAATTAYPAMIAQAAKKPIAPYWSAAKSANATPHTDSIMFFIFCLLFRGARKCAPLLEMPPEAVAPQEGGTACAVPPVRHGLRRDAQKVKRNFACAPMAALSAVRLRVVAFRLSPSYFQLSKTIGALALIQETSRPSNSPSIGGL